MTERSALATAAAIRSGETSALDLMPDLATYPGPPAASVPIGRTATGLQVIAGLNRNHDAIAAARLAHDLMWS